MIERIPVLGQSISLYYLFWLIGAIIVLIIGCRLGNDRGFGFSKSVLYITGAIAMGYALLWGTSLVVGGGKLRGLNFVRIVTVLPIPVYLLTRIMKDRFADIADMIAPLLAIFHGVTHIGCIFPGCCYGYPSIYGIYSNEAKMFCFPIQPIEAASSILVGILLLYMDKHNIQRGKLYAWYLTLFGSTRFIWEFFRDNEKIWHGISELAFHALAAMLLGLTALAVEKWIFKGSSKHEEI